MYDTFFFFISGIGTIGIVKFGIAVFVGVIAGLIKAPAHEDRAPFIVDIGVRAVEDIFLKPAGILGITCLVGAVAGGLACPEIPVISDLFNGHIFKSIG